MDKKRKEEILEKIQKAGSEEYVTNWDDKGIPIILKKKSEIKKGKRSKSAGLRFELRVRKDLEDKDWIVDKWSNNVDLEIGKVIVAKKNWKFNPFRKIMMPLAQGTGFPDFICFQKMGDYYKVIGVEVKKNGILSKVEKEKCKWLLDKEVFSEIWVGKGVKEGRRLGVRYDDFRERYNKLFE